MDHNFKLCSQYQNFEVRWKVKLINVWMSAPKKGSSHFVWYFHSNWKLTEKVFEGLHTGKKKKIVIWMMIPVKNNNFLDNVCTQM